MLGIIDLPLELLHRIASYLESDQDLECLTQTCHTIDNTINDATFSFWRKRFASKYEIPDLSPEKYDSVFINGILGIEYQSRHMLLEKCDWTRDGKDIKQWLFLLVTLRDLILESFHQSNPSLNISALKKFCQKTDLISFFSRNHDFLQDQTHVQAKQLFQVISLVLAPLSPWQGFGCQRRLKYLDLSRQKAYSSLTSDPLIQVSKGEIIPNFSLLLHMICFWQCHISREAEMTLYANFASLPASSRPDAWSERLENGLCDLGRSWKCCYAYVSESEMSIMRGDRDDQRSLVLDIFSGDGLQHIGDYELRYVDDVNKIHWPLEYERIIPVGFDERSSTIPRSSRYFRLDDSENSFEAVGWQNALPEQEFIPGWQRIVMIGHGRDASGVVNLSSIFAYEMVVSPGGTMMIGRWWNVDSIQGSDHYSGPLIMWKVKGGFM